MSKAVHDADEEDTLENRRLELKESSDLAENHRATPKPATTDPVLIWEPVLSSSPFPREKHVHSQAEGHTQEQVKASGPATGEAPSIVTAEFSAQVNNTTLG